MLVNQLWLPGKAAEGGLKKDRLRFKFQLLHLSIDLRKIM